MEYLQAQHKNSIKAPVPFQRHTQIPLLHILKKTYGKHNIYKYITKKKRSSCLLSLIQINDSNAALSSNYQLNNQLLKNIAITLPYKLIAYTSQTTMFPLNTIEFSLLLTHNIRQVWLGITHKIMNYKRYVISWKKCVPSK